MTAPYLAYPVRLGYDGTLLTNVGGSEDDVTQQVHLIAATVLGERPMTPGFGVPRPQWTGITSSAVQAVVDQFGPEGVTIQAVTTDDSDLVSRVRVEWSQ